MTYTYKLARRLARMRRGPSLLLPFLAACAAGEPTGITSPTDTPENQPSATASTDGPVAVSPRKVTLERGQHIVFRAFTSLTPGSSQVTSIEWTATGGTIASDGSYTPAATGTFSVIGKRKGNPKNPSDTATVDVVPPQSTLVGVRITPATAMVAGGMQQQFTAVGLQSDATQVPIGVTWTATGGAIDAGGLFTAGTAPGSYMVIASHATGFADTAAVTVPGATLTSITLSPSTVSLNAGQTQQFSVTGTLSDGSTAAVPVAYDATGGIISAAGTYTAGTTAGTFSIIATAPDGHADTSSVAIASAPTPPAPAFSSVTAVRTSGTPATVSWQTTLVGVTQFELQKAPKTTTLSWTTYNYPTGTARSQVVTLAVATSSYCFRLRGSKPTVSAWSDVVCVDPTTAPAPTLSSITMTPATVSISTGGTQQFSVSGKMSDGSTATVAPTYSATGGTISAAGLYTAGSSTGSFRVIATAQGKADTSAVTISAPSTGGSLWWSADFESGAWPSGTTFEQCGQRIKVYSNGSKPSGAPAAARRGSHFVGYTVLESDVSPCTPTGNPRASGYREKIFHPGDEVWESFSVYIPNGFPSIPHFMMLQEDYGAPFNSPPPNGVWLQNFDGTGNKFYITGNYDAATKTNVRVWSTKIVTGVWHDFMVHKRFATDKSGWLEVWFDGQQVVFDNGSTRLTGQQTMLSGATSANFSMMQYRSAGMFPVSQYPNGLTIYFDELRVGTSRSSVELTSSLLASMP